MVDGVNNFFEPSSEDQNRIDSYFLTSSTPTTTPTTTPRLLNVSARSWNGNNQWDENNDKTMGEEEGDEEGDEDELVNSEELLAEEKIEESKVETCVLPADDGFATIPYQVCEAAQYVDGHSAFFLV